jgi:hypothetical protein
MTEQEWLQATDPQAMLEFIQGKASDRKLRLLTVAACRHISDLLPERCRTAATVLELYADGLVGITEYREAWSQADIESRMCAQDPPDATTYAAESVMISSPPTTASVEYALSTAAIAFGSNAANGFPEQDYDLAVEMGRMRAAAEQAQFIRCIFGPLPFRPITLDPAWLTWQDGLLVSMAQQMYESGDFTDLPILADALEEAGCTDADILSHCRSGGEHVRGCWVVDALLGKQ